MYNILNTFNQTYVPTFDFLLYTILRSHSKTTHIEMTLAAFEVEIGCCGQIVASFILVVKEAALFGLLININNSLLYPVMLFLVGRGCEQASSDTR